MNAPHRCIRLQPAFERVSVSPVPMDTVDARVLRPGR